MATILSPDGARKLLIGDGPNKELSLAQMQAAVGGLIEPVYHPKTGKCLVIVNEEAGYLDSQESNDPAREVIAKAYDLPNIDHVVEIRGNVIVVDGDDGENWY